MGKITGLNLGLINLASAEVEAYDAQLDYTLETGIGSFSGYALGTWQTHYRTQLTPDLAVVENIGYTSSFPVKFKANFGLNWTRGPWSAGWMGRYFDSYLVINPAVPGFADAQSIANQGNGGRVSSQVYHDLFATYRIGAGASPLLSRMFLSSAELRAGIQNIFNTRPPVDTAYANGYSTFGDPQLASYYMSVKVAF